MRVVTRAPILLSSLSSLSRVVDKNINKKILNLKTERQGESRRANVEQDKPNSTLSDLASGDCVAGTALDHPF